MRTAPLLPLLVTGCVSTSFHSRTGVVPPPVAERAVVVEGQDAATIAQRGQLLGTIDASGWAINNQADLDDKAAKVAAQNGGTHVAVTEAGDNTWTTINPATRTRTCSHDDGTRTCETSWMPPTETTSSRPYAELSVYRVDPAQWAQLPDDLRPAAYAPGHHVSSAADGWGGTIGYFSAPYPGPSSGSNGNVFPTTYSQHGSQTQGVWLGGSYITGSTELAIDVRAGGGTITGTAMAQGSPMVSYTTGYDGMDLALRVGKRAAWQDFALSAGVGIAGGLWMPMGMSYQPSDAFVEPPQSVAGDFYFPLWSELTFKPSCEFGVQGMASYDLRPQGGSAPSFGVGLIYQPASACR